MKRLAACLITAIFVVGLIGFNLSCAQTDYASKVKETMKALQEKSSKLGEPKAEGKSLYFGGTKMNGNYTTVDEIKDIFGGATATFFLKKGVQLVKH
ncbi:MAG: hypothetical protein V1872_09435 [bacterium]